MRDRKIDILKGMAIYLVVMGHIIAWFFEDFSNNKDQIPHYALSLWSLIYSFHMPLFVFLSGYVFMNPDKQYSFSHIMKRCLTYLIPFITMGVLLFCWRGGKVDNYWYFRSLIEFSLLFFTIYRLVCVINKLVLPPPPVGANRNNTIVISGVLFICAIIAMNIAIKSNSVFDVIMDKSHLKLGIYFALGCMYRFFKSCLDRFLLSQIVMLMSFLVVFLCFVYDYNFSYIRPIITIVLLINIAGILADGFNCKHLENVGKGTLGIYIFHFFFTFKLYVIGHFLSEISVVGLSTSVIVQLILVIPVAYIITKCCIYITNIIKSKDILSLVCLGK